MLKAIKKRSLIVLPILVIAAFITNYYFTIPLYGLVTLQFGQLFAILALMMRGPSTALLVSLCSGIALYYSTENWLLGLLGLLEIVAFWLLTRRGTSYLTASILFWLIAGVPLTWLRLELRTELPDDFTILVLMKMILNGVLYTALAISINVIISTAWKSRIQRPAVTSLAGRIFYLSFLSILIPSMLIAIIFTARSANDAEQAIVDDVTRKAKNLASVTQDYVDQHVRAVDYFAQTISSRNTLETEQQLLTQMQATYSGFLTMLITDQSGQIIAGAPANFYQRLQQSSPNNQFSVADRAYFQQPLMTGETYVSEVFRGRGFGRDPIIAISAPLFDGNEFTGVVEGSLNLPNLNFIEQRVELDSLQQAVIVTDANHQVIFATERLGLAELAKFQPQSELFSIYSAQLRQTTVNDQTLLFTEAQNPLGWHVYILAKPSQISAVFAENLWIFLTALVAVTLFFTLIAHRFSLDITRPLKLMAERMRSAEPLQAEDIDLQMSDDLRAISSELNQARDLMQNFNRELTEQVRGKTAELEALNKKLFELSQHDGLTQLLNRRAFDESALRLTKARPNDSFSFMLIDIDDFKAINDQYGHPVGDTCLTEFARILRDSFARVDAITGRYGGEEFAVLSFAPAAQFEASYQSLRQRLAEGISTAVGTLNLSISAGVTFVQDPTSSKFVEVVAHTDKLLYASKAAGKDSIHQSTL
ncbi:sensor domain-containing diguanylate cyclase [Pseudidiomarina taiwanensis]|uniref:diguanylate cyclase n=1 Tax=Pseudidiomarina taiwanensis TaxID=337250 RepID=A0A432ZCP4_9GAMM|nr:diguanylate cyclase [Pseudidiomarina taiwanensis]RUO75718.1 hypothetical protein CWI83_10110 [Pseudidiomarina taiwanensis]